MSKALLKIPEVAQRLGTTETHVRELGRLGILPIVKLGRRWRCDADSLEEFIKQGGKALPGGWRKEK